MIDAQKQAPATKADGHYRFVYDSAKLTKLMKNFENVVNSAVIEVYGDAGRTFAVESAGWDAKLHFVLREIREDPKKCAALTLSEMFNPKGSLWNYIIKSARSKGFHMVDEFKKGFQEIETETSFMIEIPGSGLLRT